MTLTSPPRRLDYHRQALRVARPRWWRPLAVLALTACLFVVGAVLLVVPLVVLAVAIPDVEDTVDRAFTSSDLSDPLAATFMLVSIATLLPAALLAVRLAGGRGAGTLSSVAGRIRRRLLARCLGLAVLLTVPAILALVTLERGWQNAAITDRTLPIVALALLAVPMQAAAEEYVFRGLLMQTIGAWLRHPAFAIVLPVPLFTLGHDYDVLGLVDVTAFGLVAGWLTWRTGGLEAAIGLHVANNAVLVGFGGFGLVDLAATEGTATGLACSLCFTGAYAWLVRGWADRRTQIRTGRSPSGSAAPWPHRRVRTGGRPGPRRTARRTSRTTPRCSAP